MGIEWHSEIRIILWEPITDTLSEKFKKAACFFVKEKKIEETVGYTITLTSNSERFLRIISVADQYGPFLTRMSKYVDGETYEEETIFFPRIGISL